MAKFSVIFVQEPDTEICANMLDSLNECLQVCNILIELTNAFGLGVLFDFCMLWN